MLPPGNVDVNNQIPCLCVPPTPFEGNLAKPKSELFTIEHYTLHVVSKLIPNIADAEFGL